MALEYGMTSEEFWEDDPNLLVSYHTFFINKKKREYEEKNYECWLQGLYGYESQLIASDNLYVKINNTLGGKAKFSGKTYPSEPYDLHSANTKEKQETSPSERKEQFFNKFNYFATMKKRFVENIKNK